MTGTAARALAIDVWADVACPWCWIGERRLAQALAPLAATHPDLTVERRWRPFQLQPQLPAPGRPWADFAREKFGGPERAAGMFAHVAGAGADVGCDFRFDRIAAAPNTTDAHRLVLFARHAAPAGDDGTHELALAEALFAAYFRDGRHVGERGVLRDVAAEAGLDADAATRWLEGPGGTLDVQGSQREAGRLGIQGVPFVVLDGRLGVSGAQPTAVFRRAIEAALEER